MRNSTCCQLLAFVLIVGCGSEDQTEPAPGALKGLTVATGGTRTVFMGRRADLLAEYQDSLTGKAGEEQWYRIDLPETLMPTASDSVIYDLAKTPNITVTVNFWLAGPEESVWSQFSAPTAGDKLTGNVRLDGNDTLKQAVTDKGEHLGAGLECTIIGDVKFSKYTFEGHKAEFVVGTVAQMMELPGTGK